MSDIKDLTDRICVKMQEVEEKTPKTCYQSYKNQLYSLLKKMDTSIESFNRKV